MPVKTRTWILLLTALALLCGLVGVFLLRSSGPALSAEIYSGGRLVTTLPLAVDQSLTVTGPGGGSNVITVKGGKIAVTDASCPDHYCMRRGFCSSGAPIICLPNALEIRFTGRAEVDIALG